MAGIGLGISISIGGVNAVIRFCFLLFLTCNARKIAKTMGTMVAVIATMAVKTDISFNECNFHLRIIQISLTPIGQSHSPMVSIGD